MPESCSGILASRMSGVPPIWESIDPDCPRSAVTLSILLINKELQPHSNIRPKRVNAACQCPENALSPAVLPIRFRRGSRRPYYRPRSGADRSLLGQRVRPALRGNLRLRPDPGE